MKPLDEKVVMVTGAGRGIGRAIALVLGRAGARIVLTARSKDELAAVAEELRREGGEALVIPADLTRDEEMDRLVEQAVSAWGPVDILINNAGWGQTASVVKSRVSDWDRTFQVNLRAPYVLSRLVLPAMLEKGDGAVINIASISAIAGHANGAAYSASKFGLRGFSQSLYEEVREHGIRVAAILPGFVDTVLIPPTRRLDRTKMIRPEDVAQAVLFVLTALPASCPVEITLRPQKSPYR
ncbi:MAG TPA: SDR family oxidoreductase [Candidatus Binatia bacterium]